MNFRRFSLPRRLVPAGLVAAGAVFGFVLALLVFSCSTRPGAGGLVRSPAPDAAPREGETVSAESLVNLQGSFRSVSEKVMPVVVMINVVETRKQTPERGEQPWFYYFFGRPDESPGDRGFRSRGLGSGVLLRKAGKEYYVLTNNHVVGTAEEISVQLHDRREFKARLVGKDERKDLAVVSFQADGEDLPLARLGDSDSLHVGDWVLAVGNPFGLESTVTTGIVSALGRRGGPEGNISDFIQTDASINQGNSGGALVNLAGEVVGINTWITSPTGGSIGLGFAIPINNVKRAVEDLISSGTVRYGWLGVSISSISPEMADSLGLKDARGAFVFHVFKGSPADKGGLLPGDFITSLDGRRIGSSDELVQLVGDLPVGRRADFVLFRGGKEVRTTVTVSARDDQQSISEQSRNLWPGITVMPITEDLRREMDLPREKKGLLVRSVEPRTPGALAGFKTGDIILEMNGSGVSTLTDFYRVLNDPSQKKIDFVYEREEVRMSVGVFR